MLLSEIPGTVIFAAATYLIMVAAFYLSKARRLHMIVMAVIIVIDAAFPIYLVLTHDWWKRLIIDGEILSFMLWMHLILVLTLYMFYGLQISAARRMLRGEGTGRDDHRRQAMGILIVRALVIITGALFAK